MINEQLMLPIGTLLQNGKYRVIRFMASGGFGNTYEVEHVTLGKRLAMKEFFMQGVNRREGLNVTMAVEESRQVFQQMRLKFMKEAQRLASLNEMHIIEVSDFFEEFQTVYYVMRLIDGESLAATMKRTGMVYGEDYVQQVLWQALAALECVHGQGIYHLDLKPDNIMHDAVGHCWLIDFGASKQLTVSEARTMATSTALCFTPGYAPIEQISCNTKLIGPWSDFYALGATLYNLLTGQVPQSPDVIMVEGDKALTFPSTVSTPMRQLILWMMKPNPTDRPQSVQLIQAFLSTQNSGITNSPNAIHMVQQEDVTKEQLKEKHSNSPIWKWIWPFVVMMAVGVAAGIYHRNNTNSKNSLNIGISKFNEIETKTQEQLEKEDLNYLAETNIWRESRLKSDKYKLFYKNIITAYHTEPPESHEVSRRNDLWSKVVNEINRIKALHDLRTTEQCMLTLRKYTSDKTCNLQSMLVSLTWIQKSPIENTMPVSNERDQKETSPEQASDRIDKIEENPYTVYRYRRNSETDKDSYTISREQSNPDMLQQELYDEKYE